MNVEREEVFIMRKRIFALCICLILFVCFVQKPVYTQAKGTSYEKLEDVYYAKAGCVVYAEPTYTSTVLTTIEANTPVRVVGYYTNGWYRINIGVIAYCKMDSLTSAGEIGIINTTDPQLAEAKQIADSLGYKLHVLKLNKEKIIKKDIFNSYIDEKAILFVKIDDNLAVMFKMVYGEKINKDINLNFSVSSNENGDGSRTVTYSAAEDTEFTGQVVIFQYKVGYDKAVDIFIEDVGGNYLNKMNTYFTEFSVFAYAPVTQIGDMEIIEAEIMYSLSENTRLKMSDLKKGVKYLSYDEKGYRNSISNKYRKDTEYIDYVLK